MKKRRLRLRPVLVSDFVGLISTDITDRFLNIFVYSRREFQGENSFHTIIFTHYTIIFFSIMG